MYLISSTQLHTIETNKTKLQPCSILLVPNSSLTFRGFFFAEHSPVAKVNPGFSRSKSKCDNLDAKAIQI